MQSHTHDAYNKKETNNKNCVYTQTPSRIVRVEGHLVKFEEVLSRARHYTVHAKDATGDQGDDKPVERISDSRLWSVFFLFCPTNQDCVTIGPTTCATRVDDKPIYVCRRQRLHNHGRVNCGWSGVSGHDVSDVANNVCVCVCVLKRRPDHCRTRHAHLPK